MTQLSLAHVTPLTLVALLGCAGPGTPDHAEADDTDDRVLPHGDCEAVDGFAAMAEADAPLGATLVTADGTVYVGGDGVLATVSDGELTDLAPAAWGDAFTVDVLAQGPEGELLATVRSGSMGEVWSLTDTGWQERLSMDSCLGPVSVSVAPDGTGLTVCPYYPFEGRFSDDGTAEIVSLTLSLTSLHSWSASHATGLASDISDAVILTLDGGDWTDPAAWSAETIPDFDVIRDHAEEALSSPDGQALVALGGQGKLARQDAEGEPWTVTQLDTDADLRSTWESSEDGQIVVGNGGAAFHFDGSDWTSLAGTGGADLTSVSGQPCGAVVAVDSAGTVWQATRP